MDDTKHPLQSTTLWVSLITAIAAFVPPVQLLVAANPGIAMGVASLISAGLRLAASKKIAL